MYKYITDKSRWAFGEMEEGYIVLWSDSDHYIAQYGEHLVLLQMKGNSLLSKVSELPEYRIESNGIISPFESELLYPLSNVLEGRCLVLNPEYDWKIERYTNFTMELIYTPKVKKKST